MKLTITTGGNGIHSYMEIGVESIHDADEYEMETIKNIIKSILSFFPFPLHLKYVRCSCFTLQSLFNL